MDDGRERGFVSAVSFRDVDFRFAFAGWLRRSFFQTNYRAYVRDADGQRAVFFFGTTLDSRLVAVPRLVWGMPWHPGRTSIEAEWMNGVCTGYRHRCDGAWGGADVALIGSADPAGRLDGFADADDTAHVLTHPLDGWFRRPDGRLGAYAVWHERMNMTVGRAVRARYDVFDELGLVVPGGTSHSVLLIPSVEFDVLLPPRKPGRERVSSDWQAMDPVRIGADVRLLRFRGGPMGYLERSVRHDAPGRPRSGRRDERTVPAGGRDIAHAARSGGRDPGRSRTRRPGRRRR